MPRRLLPIPLLALAFAAHAGVAAAARLLPADGKWLGLKVEAPGDKVTFGMPLRAGCRYRITVEPQTLTRPVIDLSLADGTAQRFGSPERGQPAVYEWDAESTNVAPVEVSGFSALTGTARIRLEALGPDGRPQAKPEPWLAPGGERGRVGDLLLGEAERWILVVEPGKAYELEPLRGGAHGVALRVLGAGGAEIARSLRPWLGYAALRFRVPPPPPPGEPAPMAPASPTRTLLEVRGMGGCGGTYGLKLRLLPDDAPLSEPPSQPPAPVEAGLVAGEALAFRANPGDVALLYTPRGPGTLMSSRAARQVGSGWVELPPEAPLHTLRTQEGDHMACLRVEEPGTYRFLPFPAGSARDAVPQLVAGADLGGAPLLLGVVTDPRVRAKAGASWKTVGLGLAVPGFDYLFVAEGAPNEGVALRVRGLNDKTLAARPASGEALPMVAGMGPSLRFRVASIGLHRLEVRGAGQLVVAVMRRASN